MERIPNNRIVLPPSWCNPICRNATSEVCLEHCAIKRDCSYFEPKKGIDLVDLPRFPLHEWKDFTREEKGTIIAVYTAKIVDHLQGVTYERELRPFAYRRRSLAVPPPVKVPGVFDGAKEETTIYQNFDKTDSDKRDGSSQMDSEAKSDGA